ncbi:MAG: DUF1573 domain-containing protein [Planctomycetes bacterium]|nr:DUF1573 domain-containing protein [Planctomycetota bacterium]
MARSIRDARRAASSPAVMIGIVVGAIVLVAGGYLLGRGAGSAGDTPEIIEAVAGSPAQTPTPVVTPTAASPNRPGSVQANADPPQWAVDAARKEIEQDGVKPEKVAEGPPPYEFVPAKVDFGFVRIGDDMEQDIKIRNLTDEPLKIVAMRPDCKCTTVQDLAGTVIPPNSEIEFTAVVDGRDSAGSKTSEIRFIFEGYGPASLELRSVVTRAVRVEPGYIVALDGVNSGTLSVGALDRNPFRLLSMNGGPVPYADGFDPERDEPRFAYKIAWDLRDYDPTTCLNPQGERVPVWIVLETDHPEAPIVDVRVRHLCTRIQPPTGGRMWVLSKLREVVDELEPGASAEFDVDMKWLRSAKPTDTIRAVRSESPDQFAATIVRTKREEDRITATVRVTIVPSHRGLIYGDIRFYGYTVGHEATLKVIGRVGAGEQRTQR